MAHTYNYKKGIALFLVILGGLLVLNGSVLAQDHTPHDELDRTSPIPLDPASGGEVGFVYEAFLSPHQEGGEEEATPAFIPPQFRSTEESVPRSERTSRGHAVLEFTNDLSRAYVYLAVENVNLDELNLLHLHCGRPGQLGPIIVDFGMMGDLKTMLEDGVMILEITNEDLEAVLAHAGHSPVDAFTSGCPIVPDAPSEKTVTISGLESIARQGELYFNLHTTRQTYFGDIRGKFRLVE